eukprot:5790418-Pyramimonas_sp.AAC.1
MGFLPPDVMDMIRLRRGSQRATRKWFMSALCADAKLSSHRAPLSHFASRLISGGPSNFNCLAMPATFASLVQMLRFSATLFHQRQLC